MCCFFICLTLLLACFEENVGCFIGFLLLFIGFLWLIGFHYTRTCFSWFYYGYPRVSFGSRLVLQWVWPGCTAPGYSVSSLAHSGEGGGSSPETPQTLRSSNKLQNDCFSKLFVRGFQVGVGERRSCIWAPGHSVSSVWPTLKMVAGAEQVCPRRSGAPKGFKMAAFQSCS